MNSEVIRIKDEMFEQIAERTAKILQRDLQVQAMVVDQLDNQELAMTLALAQILASQEHLDKKTVKQLASKGLGSLGKSQIHFSTARAILEVIGETDEAVN